MCLIRAAVTFALQPAFATYRGIKRLHLVRLDYARCREQLEQILEAANWAPTHNRTEPWRFTVLGRNAQDHMVDLTLTVRHRAIHA